MRYILRFALFTAASLTAITSAARAQDTPSPVEAGGCLGFSFGAWTPPLDWHAAGHERTPDSVDVGLAPGGRGWAAPLSHSDTNGTMLLFPSWWPVGVAVAIPARALAPGDTVQGRAIALVANGATPPRATVRAWQVPCGASRVETTRPDHLLPIGIWRGWSLCLTSRGQCGRDSVVYRIAAIAGAPDSVSLTTSTVGARGERDVSEIRCGYDRASTILSCAEPAGVMRLAVSETELGGRLTRRDGVYLRRVYARRARQ